MASHKSAEKRARQTERRTAANTARRSRVRAAQPEIQRGATKHIVSKNAAARRVSRLAARIKAMA